MNSVDANKAYLFLLTNISIISLSLLYEIFKIFPLLDTYYYEHVLYKLNKKKKIFKHYILEWF